MDKDEFDITARQLVVFEDVLARIERYYVVRGYDRPTTEQAMMWATSELGEAMDVLLRRSGNWKRNNPAKEVPFSEDEFLEELGDTIFMLLFAGNSVGGNAMTAMLWKMRRKIAEMGKEKTDDGQQV